ncbi:ankyrin, partial [Lepidopterella palustris CBS 459.81]
MSTSEISAASPPEKPQDEYKGNIRINRRGINGARRRRSMLSAMACRDELDVPLRRIDTYTHVSTTELLLERGADPNSPIDYYRASSPRGELEIDDRPALFNAAHTGNVDCARLLIEYGACVNHNVPSYGNVLYVAVTGGYPQMVELLLDAGALVNEHGGVLGTALKAAAAKGSLEIVRLLLKHGADINAVGGRCGTALHAAVAYGGSEDAIKLLPQHGADPQLVAKCTYKSCNRFVGGIVERSETLSALALVDKANLSRDQRKSIKILMKTVAYQVAISAPLAFRHIVSVPVPNP